jgi:hypothetical protein
MKQICLVWILIAGLTATAENIDPYKSGAQYGWSENAGWLNAEPAVGSGMHVESDRVTGWVWGENIGWINLHCVNNGTCKAVNFGVVNDGGLLSGFAWGENVGWINFDPVVPLEPRYNPYCVRIDADGFLNGWAWGENIGWIRFDKSQAWSARACVVSLDDLTNFAEYWLEMGHAPANLDAAGRVDMDDFSILASWWQDFCPDGWPLK